jgi:hypothetical protein
VGRVELFVEIISSHQIDTPFVNGISNLSSGWGPDFSLVGVHPRVRAKPLLRQAGLAQYEETKTCRHPASEFLAPNL